jgi:hypothetical protein
MALVDEIPGDYLWCRDMRHAWDPDSLVSREVFNRYSERWEIWRTVRCFNCPSSKTQKLTKSFETIRTDYDKPDDYSVSSGNRLTAKDRAQIRARTTAMHGGTTKEPKPPRKKARTK